MTKNLRLTMIAGALLLSMACSKKTDEPEYYFRFTMDGHQMNFPNALGDKIVDPVFPDKTHIQVSGISSDQKESFGFIIRGDHADMNASTYSSTSTNINFFALYNIQYNTSGDSYTYQISNAPGREPSVYTVEITSITDTEIQGKFTGNYLHSNALAGTGIDDIVEITGGEFKVKRN